MITVRIRLSSQFSITFYFPTIVKPQNDHEHTQRVTTSVTTTVTTAVITAVLTNVIMDVINTTGLTGAVTSERSTGEKNLAYVVDDEGWGYSMSLH